MRSTDLLNLIDTDEIVMWRDASWGRDGRSGFARVLDTHVKRSTQDWNTAHDGVQILITERDGSLPTTPLHYDAPVHLTPYGHDKGYDESARRRRVNEHNNRAVIDDFGNVATTDVREVAILAPAQIEKTVAQADAELAKIKREQEEAEARREAAAMADEKARRFVRAYLVDLVGSEIADLVETYAYSADDLTDRVERIEAAEIAEVSTNVYAVTVTESGFRKEVTTTVPILVLDSEEAGEQIDHEGRFVDLSRGTSTRMRFSVNQTTSLAFAALAAHLA